MSLKELCLKNICKSIYQMPIDIQDMIIKNSTDYIKEQCKIQCIKEITTEIKETALNIAKKDICDIIPYIIPEIIDDIIFSITHNTMRKNFYEKYPLISKQVIETAIYTAEYVVSITEERYVHNAFNQLNNEDEDEDEIGVDYQEYY